MTADGLTAHPLSNLLINAEADRSSSGSAVPGDGSMCGGGGGRRLVSTSGTTVCGGDGGGGGGGGDGAVTAAGSGFLQTGSAVADVLAGTVVSLVCSPLGGTGGGFCLAVAVVPCIAAAVDVLTGGVGAPLLPPPVPATNVCKTDAGTGVCSCCCCCGRWSAAAGEAAR